RAAIRARADELYEKPVARRRRAVVQQARWVVHVVDDDVLHAGVEEIAECGAARRLLFEQRRARAHRDVLEASVAEIAVQQLWLLVAVVSTEAVGFRIDVAVDDEDVRPAVEIDVEKTGAPAEVSRVDAQPRGARHIVEQTSAKVAIERWRMVVE